VQASCLQIKLHKVKKIKIAFCWTGLTGYMPACWRALNSYKDVEVRVYIEKRALSGQTDFMLGSFDSISHRIRNREDLLDKSDWINDILNFSPDLIEVTGWYSKLSQAVMHSKALACIPKILGLDHQYNKTLKQRIAPFVLKDYISRFRAVAVPGERASVYARHLGFKDSGIEKILYGLDYDAMVSAASVRENNPWPERFLFAGRYCQDKGLDILLAAYKCYRERVDSPWSLSFCGKGELEHMICGVDGVRDLGFIQPKDMPGVFAEHGAFILPSLYEPWGVVLGEACASGLPVIATAACGATVELIRPYYNGLICSPASVNDLCNAMIWMHGQVDDLETIGARSLAVAQPFSAQSWAEAWYNIARKYRQ